MSTAQRSSDYYMAVVRHRMLAAAVAAMNAALSTISSDSGAMFRIREMLLRAEDETELARVAVERAEKEL